METDEEFTHSRIIGNLLNPKGKHGCGDFFLKTFVEKLNILFEENNLHDMKLEDFGPLVNERITERYAGEVNFNTISGGSIDLVIEDSKQILLIENKIYAPDQKYQLARYFNYAKTRGNKKIVMLYLTLEGKVILQKEGEVNNIPTSLSIDLQSIPKDEFICFYTPISYKTFIKVWLKACLIYVEDRPMIYYPIKHYYNLIKKLTNQTTSKIMEKEIFENLRSSEANFNAFLSLNKIAEAFFMSIRNEIFEEIENKFKDSEFENFPQFIGDNYYKKNKTNNGWYGLAFKLKDENVVLVIGADKNSFNYGYFVNNTNFISNNGLENMNNVNEEILNFEYCKKFFKDYLEIKQFGDKYYRRMYKLDLFAFSNDESVEFIQKEKVKSFANSVYNEITINNIKSII